MGGGGEVVLGRVTVRIGLGHQPLSSSRPLVSIEVENTLTLTPYMPVFEYGIDGEGEVYLNKNRSHTCVEQIVKLVLCSPIVILVLFTVF